MHVLVTGATGMVGNNLVRLLLAKQHSVRVFVRPNRDPRPLQDLPVEIVDGDVRDPAAVQRAVQGPTHVIHAAAYVHVGRSGLEMQRGINVEGTRHVAVAARQAGLRLLHVSSVDALGIGARDQPANEATPRTGNTPCPYVVTKQEAEQVIQEQVALGLDAVVVNPGYMIGPWDWKPSSGKMLIAVATRFSGLAPTGGCSICDVRDVSAGILTALERGRKGENYILAGDNQTYFDIWRMFARAGGKRPPLMRLGPFNRFVGGLGGDLIGRLLRRELDVNSTALAMSCLFHYYDSSKARTELGYRTRPIAETVRDAWDWFRQYGYVKR